jgi:uncharacterized protein with NAD-binding domain and iron-sulfur cluster
MVAANGGNGTREPEVAIFGGGIGGLTAAQELIERGCAVTVYEANARFGGKARSFPIAAEPAPHGEHGFRFFPGFYRHVVDTMERIPDGTGGSVGDHLVETEATLVAGVDSSARQSTRTPQTPGEWLRAAQPQVAANEVPPDELAHFMGRLLTLATSCQARREDELDAVSWWDFIDAAAMSPAYRQYLADSIQSLVALRPRLGSARTIGSIYLQLLAGQLDPTKAAERILDGPTSLVWIDPWVEYLEEQGVGLRPDHQLRALETEAGHISEARVEGPAGVTTVTADQYVLATPVEVVAALLTEDLLAVAPELAGVEHLETAWMNGLQLFLAEDAPIVPGHTVYTDSAWALTSISQGQFWADGPVDIAERGDEDIEGVLSVIVSDWDTPGPIHDKPARECSRAELQAEILHQLETHLGSAFDPDSVVRWFLDPELEFGDEGVENDAPLLINTVGSLKHRPESATTCPNLTLAADFVRTNSDLASMESANEAGRRAANAIIQRTGVDAPSAKVWSLEEPRVFEPLQRQDEVAYRLGLPHPGDGAASVGKGLRELLRS